MSAFIVSDNTIHAVLSFMSMYKAHLYEKGAPLHLNDVGQVLLDENYRSVNYRYGENETPRKYVFIAQALPLTAVEVLKLIDCIAYQSCECDDWEHTRAYRLLQRIRNWVIAQLAGYDAAKWHIG